MRGSTATIIGHSLSSAYVNPHDRKPLRRDEACQEGEFLAFRVVRTDDIDAPQVSSLGRRSAIRLLRPGAGPVELQICETRVSY